MESNHPIYTEKVFADRKIFFLDLKENNRGRFVKITEDVRGRRDTIMLPIEALRDFLEALENVADYDRDNGGGDYHDDEDDDRYDDDEDGGDEDTDDAEEGGDEDDAEDDEDDDDR